MLETVFYVDDLGCPECARKIEQVLKGREGVEAVAVSSVTGRIRVKHAEGTAPAELLEAVRSMGYPVRMG